MLSPKYTEVNRGTMWITPGLTKTGTQKPQVSRQKSSSDLSYKGKENAGLKAAATKKRLATGYAFADGLFE
jgi:hypothetical protein